MKNRENGPTQWSFFLFYFPRKWKKGFLMLGRKEYQKKVIIVNVLQTHQKRERGGSGVCLLAVWGGLLWLVRESDKPGEWLITECIKAERVKRWSEIWEREREKVNVTLAFASTITKPSESKIRTRVVGTDLEDSKPYKSHSIQFRQFVLIHFWSCFNHDE